MFLSAAGNAMQKWGYERVVRRELGLGRDAEECEKKKKKSENTVIVVRLLSCGHLFEQVSPST